MTLEEHPKWEAAIRETVAGGRDLHPDSADALLSALDALRSRVAELERERDEARKALRVSESARHHANLENKAQLEFAQACEEARVEAEARLAAAEPVIAAARKAWDADCACEGAASEAMAAIGAALAAFDAGTAPQRKPRVTCPECGGPHPAAECDAEEGY